MKNILVFALAVTIAMSVALWVANLSRGSSPSASSQSTADLASTKATPVTIDSEAELRAQIRAEVEAEVRAQMQAEVRAQMQAEVQAQMQAEVEDQSAGSSLPVPALPSEAPPDVETTQSSQREFLERRYRELASDNSAGGSAWRQQEMANILEALSRMDETSQRARVVAVQESMMAAMAAQARAAEMQHQALQQRDIERRMLKQQLTERLYELRANQSFVGSASRAREIKEIMRQLTILEAAP